MKHMRNLKHFLFKMATALMLLMTGIIAFPVSAKAGTFSVTYLDVGQGDSELISCDEHYMLIDGGTSDQSQKIYSVLKSRGITHLDYIVCTHPHADHEGGLPGALAYASCDQALSPVMSYDSDVFHKFTEEMSKRNVPVSAPAVGDHFSLGYATFTVLGPTDIENSMNPNDISLVLRADYGDNSFLFTGDAEQEEQQLMMWNESDLLNVDVLKAAHHGSSNGASSAFITAVSPKLTVISCGKGNSYGHPHEETLNLIKKSGSSLYRTDLQGDITISSDGHELNVVTEKNQDTEVWIAGSEAVRNNTSAAISGQTGSGTYIINKNTKRFHYPNCPSVREMKESNKEVYNGDRQSLIDQDYIPCGRCKP